MKKMTTDKVFALAAQALDIAEQLNHYDQDNWSGPTCRAAFRLAEDILCKHIGEKHGKAVVNKAADLYEFTQKALEGFWQDIKEKEAEAERQRAQEALMQEIDAKIAAGETALHPSCYVINVLDNDVLEIERWDDGWRDKFFHVRIQELFQ